ncbi:MAG: MATE family efflux transporter [Deltaproteobacteria bacterium]|nr:MATE family efflux transporter [Deltaproteobacteria bacterium]
MTFRHQLRRAFALATPAVLAQIALMAMGVVDTAMVGRLGATPLAAVALGAAMFYLPAVFFMGLLMGLDPIVAQRFGAGDRRGCRDAFVIGQRLALWLFVPLSATIFGLAWCLPALGLPREVVPGARVYMQINALGSVGFLLFVVCRGYVQSLGHTRPLLIAALLGNVVNFVGNYLVLFGPWGLPRLGVLGCALTTVIARLTMMFVIWAVARLLDRRDVATDELRRAPERSAALMLARQLLALGWPIGTQMIAELGLFSAMAVAAGRIGASAVAAHQIALHLAALTYTAAAGIGMAGGVLVGHAVGALDRGRARHAAAAAMTLVVGLMSCSATVFALFPALLVGVFTKHAEVLRSGVQLLRIAAVLQLADGVQAVAVGCLRGAGDTAWPMRAHLLASLAVGLPVALLFAFSLGWGVGGLWWGATIGLALSALILCARLWSGRWWNVRSVPVVPVKC